MKKQNRDVIGDVRKVIVSGTVVQTYKTKPVVGRKSVTVGLYCTAVPDKNRFAMFIGGEAHLYQDADSAARGFIDYVGRDDAWHAAQGYGRSRIVR